MRTSRMLALGASTLALIAACSTGGGSSPTPTTPPSGATAPPSVAPSGGADRPTIVVGSAAFDESALFGEILAQALEADGFTVERQLNIGPRDATFPAQESGDIDLMPEYTGSMLEAVVKADGDPPGAATSDSEETFGLLLERLEPRGLTAIGYTQAQDQNAFAMRPATATELGITRMSDLAAVQAELTWGLPPECETNRLCSGALEEYGVDYASLTLVELAPCGGEIAAALGTDAGDAVDVGQLCSSQADIARFGLIVLEDDLGTQPSDNLTPILRTEIVEQAGGEAIFAAIFDPIEAALTTEVLIALNVRVSLDNEDIDDVATSFLTDSGLLP